MEHVDLLISGGTVITMDRSRRIIRDGAVAVKDDLIVAVGKRSELAQKYDPVQTIDASRRVVIPGLVNAHVHFYHGMHRGLSPDNLDGHQWSNFVHSKFATVLTEDDEVWSAYLVLLELLKSGTTTFLAAGSYNPDAVLESIPKVGLRGREGRRTYDLVILGHDALLDDTATAIRENARVMEKYAEAMRDKRIQPCVNIVGSGRCTDELMLASKKLADEYGAILNMHQGSRYQEFEATKQRVGVTPIQHLYDLGVLGPNVVLVHMVHVTERDLELVAETGSSVVFNPGTALKLGYGMTAVGKFPEMLEMGINVSLGTDAGDCANFMDITRAMYLAATVFKDSRRDLSLMGVETALEMATINGARSMGMEAIIGSIEVGKKADLVLFDSDQPEWQPLHCETYNLVLSASGGSVDTVIVDGEILMEGREIRSVDEEEVVARVKELAPRFRARSGVTPPSKWPII